MMKSSSSQTAVHLAALVVALLPLYGQLACEAYAQSTEASLSASPSKEAHSEPMVFARFDVDATTIKALSESTSSACAKSDAFAPYQAKNKSAKEADLCAPNLAKGLEAAQANNSVWSLPKNPSSLVWQQEVADTSRLSVELIDADGLPWPTKNSIANKGRRVTIQMEPIQALPKGRQLFLTGTLRAADGSRLESWSQPLLALSGPEENAPWYQAPVIKQAPRKPVEHRRKSHKRRR